MEGSELDEKSIAEGAGARRSARSRMTWRVWVLALAIVIGCGSVAFAASSSPVAPYGKYPLDRAVPVARFAKVHEAIFRRTRWAVFAYRPKGSGVSGREWPCLLIDSIDFEGGYQEAGGCGLLLPSEAEESLPPFPTMGGASGRGRDRKAETFGAIAVDPSVVRLRVDVEPGAALRLQAHLLGKHASRWARISQPRIAYFSIPRDVCVDSVTGFTKTGERKFIAPYEECPLAVGNLGGGYARDVMRTDQELDRSHRSHHVSSSKASPARSSALCPVR